jgi:hypothetical protein
VNAGANNNDSEEYLIQKGDTLWDISDTKLEDTFLWPKLWSVNPHIDHPDLIYPGIKIRIPSREELMRMPHIPKKRVPLTRKFRKKSKLKKEPKQVKRKYIIDKNLFITSGWIDDRFPSIGTVSYSPEDRRVIGKGDIAYLNFSKVNEPSSSLTASKESINDQQFYIIRDLKIVKHPVTGDILGHQIKITGILKIIGSDSDMPKAIITDSFLDINIGDGLLPYEDLEPPFISDTARTPDINGHIVESHSNSLLSGEGDIIFLDKGQKDGIEQGDVYAVFSDPPTERPIGKIQVVLLKPTTSNAVILESVHEIVTGAKWGQIK